MSHAPSPLVGAAAHPTAVAAVLAHEGGWDEALLIAGPIVAIVGLLLLAKRRVDRIAPDRPDDPADDHSDDRSIDAPT